MCLHVMFTRLHPGHLSVHAGDSSRRSEEKKSRFQCCCCCYYTNITIDHLVDLVVKVSASREADPGFDSHLSRDFPGRAIPVT